MMPPQNQQRWKHARYVRLQFNKERVDKSLILAKLIIEKRCHLRINRGGNTQDFNLMRIF